MSTEPPNMTVYEDLLDGHSTNSLLLRMIRGKVKSREGIDTGELCTPELIFGAFREFPDACRELIEEMDAALVSNNDKNQIDMYRYLKIAVADGMRQARGY